MQINFTNKQYWDLMRSVYIADWVANAICEQDMEMDLGIQEIRKHVFSLAKEMSYQDYVEYDQDLDEYFATAKLEDDPTTRGIIDRYDEHSTWENLGQWLGERDFFKKYTTEEIQDMPNEEYFLKHMECECFWEEEFEKYGLKRLIVDESKS